MISLAQNRIEQLSDMSDLKKLVNLDLSGNRVAGIYFSLFLDVKVVLPN
jgi:Leucine-rich repeat (LRR) protein